MSAGQVKTSERKQPQNLEEGGVFGGFGKGDIREAVYCGLFALQHRGQTSCGAALSDNFKLSLVRGKGLVSDAIEPFLNSLKGNMGIGHVRYGGSASAEAYAQPLISNYSKGNICISIAGKLTNSEELKAELEDRGAIFQLSSDAEILAHLIARARQDENSVEKAVLKVMSRLKGAYAVLIMSSSKLLAFRDKEGLRPLCMGQKDGAYFFSSEDCAFAATGAEFVRDLLPGELVMVTTADKADKTSQPQNPDKIEAVSFKDFLGNTCKTCIYEYLYFARPDSVIDGVSVYSVRIETGKRLFKNFPVKADLVIGAPSAGLHYALGYAMASGVPYGDGLFRNYYFGRTFERDESFKKNSIALKLNVIKAAVAGKRIVLVDDSMIRGVTAKKIIQLLRGGGAKEVHLRVASPRFVAACPVSSGIDTKIKDKSIEELCKEIGADSLAFLPADDLKRIGAGSKNCKKCFIG